MLIKLVAHNGMLTNKKPKKFKISQYILHHGRKRLKLLRSIHIEHLTKRWRKWRISLRKLVDVRWTWLNWTLHKSAYQSIKK